MILQGHVRNGMIVLDDPVSLPEGTSVSIAVSGPSEKAAEMSAAASIWATFAKITGKLPAEVIALIPADAAARHDDYLTVPGELPG